MIRTGLLALALVACSGGTEVAPEPAPEPVVEPAPAPEPAAMRVFFVEPADGATVTSPVKVVMGVEGMEVKPAGELVEGTGHHHIIIDAMPGAKGEVVPADDTHLHFGQGQTEAELTLKPGEHTLYMQFADGMHQSYGEEMRAKITITVE